MKRPVIISPSLKFLFESIELLLNVEIENKILNNILDDCEQDQVGEKIYILNSEKGKINIKALVEEYEPETIWFMFEKIHPKKSMELEELFENYEFAFGSGANYRSTDECLAIYQKGIRRE